MLLFEYACTNSTSNMLAYKSKKTIIFYGLNACSRWNGNDFILLPHCYITPQGMHIDIDSIHEFKPITLLKTGQSVVLFPIYESIRGPACIINRT